MTRDHPPLELKTVPLNPYAASGLTADEPEVRVDRTKVRDASVYRTGVMTGLVSVFGFAKWYLPALLGTGEIYTMGIWLEEWAAVFMLGALTGFVHARWSFLQPLNYFFCAYVAHLPLYMSDKFALLVLFVGLLSAGMMYLGVVAGISVFLACRFAYRSCNRLST